MSSIVTERCILPLKSDVDVEDPSSPAGVVFKNLLEIVKAQPGFLGGLWARRLGDANDVEQLVDWDSLESHNKVNNNAQLMEPLMKDIMTILRADPPWWHIHYSESSLCRSSSASSQVKTTVPASSILSSSPVISDLTDMYCSPSISSQDASAVEDAWEEFMQDALRNADGFVCAGQGWVMEEMECIHVEGGKAKVFHTAVGWESERKLKAFGESKVKDEFNEKMQAYAKHVESCLFRFSPQ
ncbi:hypothetical protein MMC11_007441 [Xylographa trunciseda]|nr:hypothetical protein [Xylographa trunciseda]